MKKSKKTMLIAAALTAAAGLAGCTNDPSDSEIAAVYGPPADYSQEISESDASADDVPESLAEDSSKYEPSAEEIPLVYGPPEAFE